MRVAPFVVAVVLLMCTACPKPATPAVSDDTATAEREALKQPDPRVLDDDRKCARDSECTLTTADCCGCASLGAQTGVRKDHLASLAKRRQPVCSAIACAQGISDDPTCSVRKAVCRAGVCVPDVPPPRTAPPPPSTPVEPIR